MQEYANVCKCKQEYAKVYKSTQENRSLPSIIVGRTMCMTITQFCILHTQRRYFI